MKLLHTALAAAIIQITGCAPQSADEHARSRSAENAHPSATALLTPFAAADPDGFLTGLPQGSDEGLLDSLRATAWSTASSPSGTAVQGVKAHGVTITLDENTRAFTDDLFLRYERGEITSHELTLAAGVLDAVYTGILRSHERLDDRSVDTLNLSLTYAALGKAALSQRLARLGLGRAPLGPDQIDALINAARQRDYDAVELIP